MAPISCSVCAIQNLSVLLNSSWISAYMITFQIHCCLQIKSYYIINSQNQVKFYMQIRPVFPGPVTYNKYNYCTDLNQKAISTHSSLTGLISHSMPEDDHQFLQQDQPRPHYGYSSLPRMTIPPHREGLDIQCPSPSSTILQYELHFSWIYTMMGRLHLMSRQASIMLLFRISGPVVKQWKIATYIMMCSYSINKLQLRS